MIDWTRRSAEELLDAYRSREVTTRTVIDQYSRRIKKSDLNAYITPLLERALDQARDIDRRRAEGEPLGALAGVPVAVKDNVVTSFAPTTCASRILADYQSPYDAAVVERLKQVDAIIVGKTNMDEFAMGSSNENSAYGPVHNPHDHQATPGGSSGGSAAAVTGHLTCLALGSDTGGSVRQPAAFSGCVGLKPGYGAVSRRGLVAFASSLDQIGPLGRSVADVKLLFDVVAGPDPKDSTSDPQPLPESTSPPNTTAAPLTLGIVSEWEEAKLPREIQQPLRRLVKICADAGHRMRAVSLPHARLGVASYYVVADAEAAANLARYDGVRFGARAESPRNLYDLYARTRGEGFGAEVKRRIMLGTYVLSAGYYEAYYLRAVKVRNLIRADFARVFAEVDFILSPTTPTPAFPLGATDDPLAMYLSDVFTVQANLAGIPALSLPVGETQSGLPVGVQMWGPRRSDHRLLAAAAEIERLVAYDAS